MIDRKRIKSARPFYKQKKFWLIVAMLAAAVARFGFGVEIEAPLLAVVGSVDFEALDDDATAIYEVDDDTIIVTPDDVDDDSPAAPDTN